MFAVFEDGSHQYRVHEGEKVQVDFREAEIGSRIEFGRVLLYSSGDDLRIGQPMLDGMRVLGEVIDHPSKKLYIQHFRRRKNYRRLKGHRQHYTLVQVRSILLPGQEAPPVTPPAQQAPPSPEAGSVPAAGQPASQTPGTTPPAQQPSPPST